MCIILLLMASVKLVFLWRLNQKVTNRRLMPLGAKLRCMLLLQIRLLQDRLHNLEIKSPIDGIVIGGDPKKSEGARLSMGHTILNVGPLEDMIVELEVRDEDIPHVAAGQPVKFRLAAHPHTNFEGTIDRVHPRSEKRESENVFIAEVRIPNDDRLLRPGMEGRAKVDAGRHMLAWNLFHRAWGSLLFRFGW